MRYLIVADVHSNLEALEAILADAGPAEATLCLGDLVGYGPDPNACVRRVRTLPNLTCVAGNHDLAAIGAYDISWFNAHARAALLWTEKQLTRQSYDFLSSLHMVQTVEGCTLVHGSLPEPMEYLVSQWEARATFQEMSTPVCLVGHTHIAEFYTQPSGAMMPQHSSLINGGRVEIDPASRCIVNCGSIGQPRDGNPLAAYGVYDPKEQVITVRRVAYNIAAVQEKIHQAGLPSMLADRLVYGR
jgi:diadenosine tetraphosphatase ApaH/serine/threonine PP2A family protein phosphatase